MREKKDINVEIGWQVRLAREEARLTQEQLAEKVDVSPQYISDLERGVVGISIATLKRLCFVLGVSSDRILFSQRSDNFAAAVEEKCKGLTREQFALLTNVINSFIDAVNLERNMRESKPSSKKQPK